jgi:putative ABC transport system ATP-binding protein
MSGSNGFKQTEQLISLRDLHKDYSTAADPFPALKGIDLSVDRGEFLTIIGKSGAGKSTMINVLSGIDRPTSGEIVIDGAAIHTMTEDQVARWRGENMGVVFQFFQLLPSLNLIENITIAMDFRNTYPLKERKERALHLLEQVDIVEHAYKTPAKISGGQQQRVAIARALANDPQIILADEPTGNLDSKTAMGILDLFEQFVDQGKTLLMATHDKEIAARSTRTVTIADGRIVSN